MANYNCSACDDLRNDAPNFVVNGLTDTEIASLKNNTGLNPSNNNKDCEDLNNMNDCLIGNMEEEVELYDVCDWKTYMTQFVPNIWTMFAGIIAAICGIWTNISNLWKMANRIDCLVDYMMKGADFEFGEYTQTGNSYIVAGKGVSFANVGQSGTSNDITITYAGGAMSVLNGSCKFYEDDFVDRVEVANYDESGIDPTTSANRKGNPRWSQTGYLGSGGELVYELRIKLADYPMINRFWNGLLGEGAGGDYEGRVVFRGPGTFAPGQRGNCDALTGDPTDASSDRGHIVPPGWVYLQVRFQTLNNFNSNGNQYTPNALVPIRLNQESIPC